MAFIMRIWFMIRPLIGGKRLNGVLLLGIISLLLENLE